MKYHNRTIYVDCDGTLVDGVSVNRRLVNTLNTFQDKGYGIVCWSSRGGSYASNVSKAIGLTPSVCISKPAIIIDDAPEDILRYARVLKPTQLNELQEDIAEESMNGQKNT